mgnify:CR=1 FL=1
MSGNIFTLILLALVAVIFAVFLKESRLPAASLLLSIAVGLIILIALLPALIELVSFFQQTAIEIGLNSFYLTTVLKVIGIAYLAEFAVQLCRDAGQGAIAVKIELAAKVALLLLALPIITALFEVIYSLVLGEL